VPLSSFFPPFVRPSIALNPSKMKLSFPPLGAHLNHSCHANQPVPFFFGTSSEPLRFLSYFFLICKTCVPSIDDLFLFFTSDLLRLVLGSPPARLFSIPGITLSPLHIASPPGPPKQPFFPIPPTMSLVS